MKKVIFLGTLVLLSLVCILQTYAKPLSADVWINDDDGKGLYHRAGTYEIGDRNYIFFHVDEDCTVKLTTTKSDGKKYPWGPKRISAGTHYIPRVPVVDPLGEAKLVLEAWTDTEYARDLLFYEVVNTIPQGFTADVWTTICGKGVYNPEYYITNECNYYPGDAIIQLYSVNEPASIKRTIIKPDGSQLVYGPKDVPAGTFVIVDTARDPGIWTIIFEALPKEGPKAEDRLYASVSYGHSPHPGAVTGYLTDKITGSELDHVRVWFPEDQEAETIVYYDGSYYIDHEAGSYRISALRENYHQQSESVDISNWGPDYLDFALSPIGPPPPENINATRGDYTDKIRITWSPVSGVTSYKLYYAMAEAGSKEVLEDNIASTSYDHISAEAYTYYYYWVKSSHRGIDSDSFTGPAWGYRAPPLPPPTTVEASKGDFGDRIRITWSSVSGATSYKLFYATSENESEIHFLKEITDPFYDDFSAPAYMDVYYRVKSSKLGVDSDSYSDFDWGYRAPPLPPPDRVWIAGKNINKIHIEWDPVPGASSYLIFRSTSPSGLPEYIQETTETFYDDYNVEENTLYYYWIKSKYRDVQSGAFSFSVFGRVLSSNVTVLPQVLMLLLTEEDMK